jgi:hypothetical protein
MGRALDELSMIGVVMNTTGLVRALVDSGFGPVFAELDRRNGAVPAPGMELRLHAADQGFQPTLDGRCAGRRHISAMQLITPWDSARRTAA